MVGGRVNLTRQTNVTQKKKARTKKTITAGFLLVRPKELKMSSFLEIDTEAIATVKSGGGEGRGGGGGKETQVCCC